MRDAQAVNDMHKHGNERTFRPENVARLESPDRLQWLPPAEVVNALRLGDSMTVADIGAGSGYFALPIARAVSRGRVLAVDFQPEMLDILKGKLAAADAPQNVTLIEGEARRTRLEDDRCDRVLVANVWHELDGRGEVLSEMRRILAPAGELFVLDWRDDVESPPGPPRDHRLSAKSVAAELESAGWSDVQTQPVGRFSYIVSAQCA